MLLQIIEGSAGKVFLPTGFMKKYSLRENGYQTLRVGALLRKVMIGPVAGDSNVAYLSQDISEDLNLPASLNYELIRRGEELCIGPVLGLLVSRKEEHLTPKRLEQYLAYLGRYTELQGLIIAFTLEGILDQEKKVIGYAYEPHSHSWKRGVFVFPDSVYIRRAHVNLNCHNRLLNIVGDRFFNAYAFNKWEMWQWLCGIKGLCSYLPDTALLNDPRVEELLKKHQKLFLKPLRGYQGIGIYSIELNEEDIILHHREGQENLLLVFKSWVELYRHLTEKLDAARYIAQQSLDLIRLDDRLIDLRAIAQKGKFGTWQIQGIISRHGPHQSIVSNVSQGGIAEDGWKTIVRYYGLDEKAAFQKWSEIERLVLLTCQQLDGIGFRYGNLGLDIALDTSDNLWIIEINNIYPDHTIALDANESQLYETVMSTPLLYAKWLSGFS